MRISALSIRARLSLWYLVVMSAGLLLFGLLSYGTLRYVLFQFKRASITRRESRLIQMLEDNRAKHLPLALSEQLQNYAVVTHEGNLFQVRNPDGSPLFPASFANTDWLTPVSESCVQPVFHRQMFDGQPITVRCHLILLDGHLVRVYLGGSVEEYVSILTAYRDALLLLLPVLLGLSAISGYLLSRHALQPVDRMTKAAAGIGIGNLSTRLPVPPAKDEIRELAVVWNQLLDRLDSAVTRLTQFSADVSHDLRTSITVMLGTAQLSLQRHRSEDEYRDDLGRIANECLTASALLDALLSIARSDAFIHEVAFRSVDLTELVIAGCRRIEDLAESKGILLDWHLPAEPIHVEGDELLLHRLLGILLDNAIKYTPEHGEIHVEVFSAASGIAMTVRDTGIGISDDIQQQIFNRFYQGDLRERRTQAGNGLGLAIARWIAEAHRLELTVRSSPMMGSTFQVRFPSDVQARVPLAPQEQLV